MSIRGTYGSNARTTPANREVRYSVAEGDGSGKTTLTLTSGPTAADVDLDISREQCAKQNDAGIEELAGTPSTIPGGLGRACSTARPEMSPRASIA